MSKRNTLLAPGYSNYDNPGNFGTSFYTLNISRKFFQIISEDVFWAIYGYH